MIAWIATIFFMTSQGIVAMQGGPFPSREVCETAMAEARQIVEKNHDVWLDGVCTEELAS